MGKSIKNSLVNICKSVKNFLVNNWVFVSVVALLVSLIVSMIFVHTPYSITLVVMGGSYAFFTIVAIAHGLRYTHLVVALSVCAMWGISALGLSHLWMTVPIGVSLLCLIFGDVEPLIPVIIGFFLSLFVIVDTECIEQEAAKAPEKRIEAVITDIEKRDHDDVIVVLNTNGETTIMPFSSSVKDAWRLEKGDTISYNVYADKIIAFEKK